MASMLTKLKQKKEFLLEVPSQTLQQTLKQLEKAIKAVWKSNFGFPKFRSFYENDSMIFPQGFTLSKHNIYLPKMKERVRFDKYRFFVGKPKQLIIKKEDDKFFVIIVCEQKDKPNIKSSSSNTVGIDVGVKRLATLSNNTYFEPLDLEKEERRKKQLQRELERRSKKTKKGKLKQKQSNNRPKTLKKLSRISQHIANKRKNFLHEISREIVEDFSFVVVEKLKMKNMTKSAKGTLEKPGKNVKAKSGLNRSILQKGWGMLFQFLEYKLEAKGGRLVRVDPKNTSKTCSRCGCLHDNNRRSQSKFVCQDCNFKINADQNAARNILVRGLRELRLAS
jgi:putative transposase